MSTYKNVEIARDFNVSNTAVTNWIEATLQGKNNLQLELVNGKNKILKNEHNRSEMLILSEQGKIYKNKGSFARVSPSSEFYKIFSEDQIIEIINNIKLHRSISIKFMYLGEGAKMWDDFVNTAKEKSTYSADTNTPGLLKTIAKNLLLKTSSFDKLNIYDLGTGNSASMKSLIAELVKAKKDFSYTGVDISKEMLNFSKANLLKDFSDIKYAEVQEDYAKNTIGRLLFENKQNNDCNVVFCVGDTIGNFENRKRVLENIRYSMDNEDLFVLTNKVEKDDYKADFNSYLNYRHITLRVAKMIGIDTHACEFVNRYDDKIRSRTSSLVMDKDYEIKFVVSGVERIVNLYKGEYLENWFHHMSTKNELISDLDYAGFELLDLTTTKEISHILTVCKAKV